MVLKNLPFTASLSCCDTCGYDVDVKEDTLIGALSVFVWGDEVTGFDPSEREMSVQSDSHDTLIRIIQAEKRRSPVSNRHRGKESESEKYGANGAKQI